MSDSQASPVFMFDDSDAEMQQAYQNARATFRYFWREIAWERRRIIPALNLAAVKAPFSDGKQTTATSKNPKVEQMWMNEIDFDGRFVSGVLLNSPNWLKTVKAGDSARFALNEISDWMYAIDGEVYGAYTVNLMRSRMDRRERKEHDDAWGLNFGDPKTIRLVPDQNDTVLQEHPMSKNMAGSLKETLAKNPSMLHDKDDRGWTLLHSEALAGSTATVQQLLDAGADPNAKTQDGMTPLQLAKSLAWDNVVALLTRRGAK
jgi:uncharacterized protein